VFAQCLVSHNVHQHGLSVPSGAFRVVIALSNNPISDSGGVHFPAAAWWEATLEPEPSTQGEQRPKIQVSGLKVFSASPDGKGEGSHPGLQLKASELNSMCWLKKTPTTNHHTKKSSRMPGLFQCGQT